MATKMATNVIDNETLINLIQNYRVIYDKTCREYRDVRKKKMHGSIEIVVKLGIEVDEAVRRYNSIKTNFLKYLKCQKSESIWKR